MAKDPYGNEIHDPFDLAIAKGVMRSTWSSAITAVVLALASGCCLPGASIGLSPMLVVFFVSLLGLVSIGLAINVVIRVFTMQPEHKVLVPSWSPWGALATAVVGAGISALQILGVLVQAFLF